MFSIYDGLGTDGLIIASAIYNVFMHGDFRIAGFATVITYGIAMLLTFFLKEVRPAEKKDEHPFREFIVIFKQI